MFSNSFCSKIKKTTLPKGSQLDDKVVNTKLRTKMLDKLNVNRLEYLGQQSTKLFAMNITYFATKNVADVKVNPKFNFDNPGVKKGKIAQDMIREGFYINNSIKEFKHFINKKRKKQIPELIHQPLNGLANIPSNQVVPSTPTNHILKKLDQLSSQTRWIALLCIRPDAKCEEIQETLQFGVDISELVNIPKKAER